MSKSFRPLIVNKNAITDLDDVFMQSQTKDELFIILEKNHQILLLTRVKFFLTRVKFLGHIKEKNTITPVKSRIDTNQKIQPPSNKKKIQEFLEMINFLCRNVHEMQLNLRPF